MKRIRWLILVLVVTGILTGCGATAEPPKPGPEEGAREWIDGIVNQDGNKMLKHTCLTQRENLKQASMWISAFSVLAQLFTNPSVQIKGDISDLKFETINQSSDQAEVRVYGELRVAVLGSAEAHQVDERWQMVRENDTWRWCGSSTSVSPVEVTQVATPVKQELVEVQANVKWQDTGISVESGNTVTIRYVSGQWSIWQGVDPLTDGEGQKNRPEKCQLMPQANLGSLIGRIGNNPPFFVGNEVTFRSSFTGNLFLSMNDCENFPGDYQATNRGSLTVAVVIGQ